MKILSRGLLLLPILLWACAEDQENILKPSQENQFKYFSQLNGLIGNEVTALYEDRAGKIWIGTSNGISVYNGTSFTNYTTNDGLLAGSVISISEDSQGEVWAGTYEGYSVFNGQTWESNIGIGISSLYLDDENTFWIGTYGFGLIQWKENGVINTYSSSKCALCNYYTKVFEDNAGEIWSSTLGGAIRFNNGTLNIFNSSQGVSDFLTAGASDSWDNVWFGSLESEKLDRIKENKVSQVDFPTGYTSVSGMVTSREIMYIATNGAGLLYYDGVVVREIMTPSNDYYLLSILADSKGTLWIGTQDNGLIRFTPKDKI